MKQATAGGGTFLFHASLCPPGHGGIRNARQELCPKKTPGLNKDNEFAEAILYPRPQGFVFTALRPYYKQQETIRYHMLKCKTTMQNQLGMHARPAAMISKIAQTARREVWIGDGNTRADASSVIDILSMGLVKGAEVLLEVSHSDDIEVIESIRDLIEDGFGEDTDG